MSGDPFNSNFTVSMSMPAQVAQMPQMLNNVVNQIARLDEQAPNQQPYPTKHHRTMRPPQPMTAYTSFRARSNDPWDEFHIENWDFSKVSREDAKTMVRALSNTLAVVAFSYVAISFAVVGGIFLLILKRVRRVAQRHD